MAEFPAPRARVDPAELHRAWAADIAETQRAEVNFPLIADPDRHVATPRTSRERRPTRDRSSSAPTTVKAAATR
jgi:hypothetical protein